MNDQEIESKILKLHSSKMMYGSPAAPFWFVGLEEGNHVPKDQVEELITTAANKHDDFTNRGIRTLRGTSCNAAACPQSCKNASSKYLPCKYSGNNFDARYQTTWGSYIKLLLWISRENFKLDDVRYYQKFNLGDTENTIESEQSCLLELFPLHCQRREDWPYADLSSIDGLEHLDSKDNYWNKVKFDEWDKIVKLIRDNQPEFVFLFGNSFDELMPESCDTVEKPVEIPSNSSSTIRATFGTIDSTMLIKARHPSASGTSDLYWKNLAAATVFFNNEIATKKAA